MWHASSTAGSATSVFQRKNGSGETIRWAIRITIPIASPKIAIATGAETPSHVLPVDELAGFHAW